MSILSGWLKTRAYRKTSDGYKKESRDTSAETVYMNDGSTVQDSLTSHIHDTRYYTKSEINNKLSSKASSSHTHNYAGSETAGGSAISADKLTSSAGSSTQPVYFHNGKPMVCNYTLGKSVPSNAIFTDTWRGIQNNLNSDSTTESLSASQGKVLKTLVDSKSPSNHNHDTVYMKDVHNGWGTYVTTGAMNHIHAIICVDAFMFSVWLPSTNDITAVNLDDGVVTTSSSGNIRIFKANYVDAIIERYNDPLRIKVIAPGNCTISIFYM